MKHLFLLVALLIPGTLVAQKPEKTGRPDKAVRPAKVAQSPLPKAAHSDLTFEVVDTMPADSLIEADVVYMAASGAVEVSASEDGLAHILDADGTDGAASVSVPAGAAVWGAATGKPKSTASLNGVAFDRGKGRPAWQDVTAGLAGATAWAWESTGAGVKLRFYAASDPVESAPE